MSKGVRPGHNSVTAYLVVEDLRRQLAFIAEAFGGEETKRLTRPDGTVHHAEIRIVGSIVMLGLAGGPWRPMPTCLYVYVEDTDASYQAALRAGAVSLMAPADQYFGDRKACVQDPFGNLWFLATHLVDVPIDELHRRADASEPGLI